MYGTVARLRVKADEGAALMRTLESFANGEKPRGLIAEYILRADDNPNDYIMTVVFASKEAYRANAASPEQHIRYEQLLAHFAAEPEWRDGEIAFAYPAERRA